jgi:ABC-type transport system substrate-binding protein
MRAAGTVEGEERTMAEDRKYTAYLRHRLTRRTFLTRTGAAGAVLSGGALLAGCSSGAVAPAAAVATSAPAPVSAAAQPTATPAPPAPKRGGTFRWAGSGGWPHLDPHLTTNSTLFGFGIGVCWSRLLKFKLKGVELPAFIPTGDLAESWEQPDDVTYIFKLRRGVKFQNVPPVNGREFTSEDVLYSFNRQRTRDAAFVNASILQAVTRLEAPDRYTVRITVDKPSADFLINIALAQSLIIARETVDLKGDLKEGPMLGTGAFIMEKIEPQGTTRAVRNPDYFLPGQPYVDAYEFTLGLDPQARRAAFIAGNLDIMQQGSATLQDVEGFKRAIPGVQTTMVKGVHSGTELGFNHERKPFDDVRVRQALYKGIDPQVIVDTAYGTGWLSVGLAWPSIDYALPKDEISRLYRRDVEGAKRLLAEAGHANGLDLTLTVANQLPDIVAAGELMQQQWRDINVRTTLRVVDFPTYSAQVQSRREFEAEIGAPTTPGSADGVLFAKYHSTGSQNFFGIKDTRLDQMIERQTTLGRNPEERKKLILDIQRYIIEQGYVRFFHTFESPAAFQPYVRDLFQGYGALALETEKYSLVWYDK